MDVSAEASVPEALASALLTAQSPVFLTGQRLGEPESPEIRTAQSEWPERASLEVFMTEPGRFWEFFFPLATMMAAREPNDGHRAVARLQQTGLISGLITQSVDRLHQKAGSTDVVELYGHLVLARCERCGERYGLPEVEALIAASPDGVPRCTIDGCGFPLRPAGTLWNEPLPPDAITKAWELAGAADLLVVLDSPLRTVPVSLLPSVPLTRNMPLVMIGPDATQYDRYAAMVVRENSAEMMVALADLVSPAPAE
jgi:NAD-dependent deacetylase